jgi:hypothetical protein
MWVFPLVAAVVAMGFSAMLLRRVIERRRPFELVWAIALLMYAGGSLALFLGTLDGWTTGEYRAYWLLGAVLNVPFLAYGELLLLVRVRVLRSTVLLLLLFATAFAVNRVRTSGLDPATLAEDLPLGREVWAPDDFTRRLAQIYAYPAYAFLLAGTLWSALRMRRTAALRDRFQGTLAIALGATVVAAGSAFAAEGILSGFSATLALGIVLMFWGFLRASRPRPLPAPGAPAG